MEIEIPCNMKKSLTLVFLAFVNVLCSEEIVYHITVPPFAKEDISDSLRILSRETSYEDLKSVPAEELRGILTGRKFAEQLRAATELLERNDSKTVLRLVYSLRQGNVAAHKLLGAGFYR